jgi:sodium/bile acid cotransporter 7
MGVVFPDLIHGFNQRWRISPTVVRLLFLIIGFTLPSDRLRSGLRNARLHLFLQLFIFVITPLFLWSTATLLRPLLGSSVLVGIFALSCLPTTVSSCIVLTQNSGGNTVGSAFNATVANVAGIFVTPFILSLLLKAEIDVDAAETGKVMIKLLTKMVVPIVVGQLLRLFFRNFARAHGKKLGKASRIGILLIVLVSVAASASRDDFFPNLRAMPTALVYLALAHLTLLSLAYLLPRWWGFSREDRISALFVAPQKTVAMGAPFLTIYFATRPDLLGIALLPILFYHPFQLIVAGIVSRRLNISDGG